MKTLIAWTLVMVSAPATAANYKYNELMIKDYDEMLEMVQSMAEKAKEAGGEDGGNEAEAIEHLREALKLIFSRPNSDNMIAKLVPEVRRELIGFNAFEDSLSSLASEAITAVKDKKGAVSVQSTSLFILENLLSEIAPEAGYNKDMRKIIERIRDADLEISKDVQKDRKIRGMFTTKNPSELAKKILEPIEKAEKDKKKKKK